MIKYSCLLLFFIANNFPSLCQQNANLVRPGSINTSLHQQHIGKIYFTNQYISSSSLHDSDLLQSYTLTNKSDLFFIAFFDNSLTNYIHHLSPGITADSIHTTGNFQFTLLIDDKLVYQSNLLPGAPRPLVQDTATMLNRPLIDNVNGQGTWSESFWNRFFYHGGDSALTDGNHLLRMEIRPYINAGAIKTGELMAAGELKLKVLRHPTIDISTINLNKTLPYKDLAVSTENFDSNTIKLLKGNINEAVFKKISSIIVIKNGKILIEEYFNGEDRNTLHDTRSVGKSFASTLMGIAIQDGYIKNENRLLNNFYQLQSYNNFSKEKKNCSIKELLTMSSGFDGNDEDDASPGNEENMYPSPDWVKFALDLPFKPGYKGRWKYFTAGVVLLGDILNKSVKDGLKRYAEEKLFKPLKITNYQWEYTPQHVPNTAGGLRMNALDYAIYGQLYKNGGIWKGQQIIPAKWIAKTFTKQQSIAGRDNEFYGYLFWNKHFKVNDKLYEAYYCAGNGGNYILIFKDQPLVIVITATAYGMPYAHPQVTKMLSQYILPAVIK